MKHIRLFSFVIVGLALLIARTAPGEQTNLPPAAPNRQDVREQLSRMSPEERKAKLEEMRKHRARVEGAAVTNQANAAAQFSPEQRQAKLKAKIEELEAKKRNGSITPVESKQLERLNLMQNRVAQQPPPPPPPPAPAPTDKPAAQKPDTSSK